MGQAFVRMPFIVPSPFVVGSAILGEGFLVVTVGHRRSVCLGCTPEQPSCRYCCMCESHTKNFHCIHDCSCLGYNQSPQDLGKEEEAKMGQRG